MPIAHKGYYMLVFNDLFYMMNMYKENFLKCQDMTLARITELLKPVIAASYE